ncbi:hypothetical protein LCGC14_1758460 [marine sediment metagenome]|uniref:Uncharacterized protein n=1 Tax=marine sediment metagenome TaxID=412755 RepID=A0A0F9H1T4_9ZZZZ
MSPRRNRHDLPKIPLPLGVCEGCGNLFKAPEGRNPAEETVPKFCRRCHPRRGSKSTRQGDKRQPWQPRRSSK